MKCDENDENLIFPIYEQSIIYDCNRNNKDDKKDTLLIVSIMLILSGVFTFTLLYYFRSIS